MGDMVPHASTSLARLKALDGLKQLPLQLHEAQQLCNHSARAEMILRWLLPRLKTSTETRTDPGPWNLFTSCLRLLPVQKIASILGSGTLHEILQATCAEQSLSKDTLHAISNTWTLLHDMSSSPPGAAVTAVLRGGGVMVAEICGNWYQHAYAVLGIEDPTSSIDIECSLLSVGLQLWRTRERSAMDDLAFNTKCMPSACLLVVLLGKSVRSLAVKRKRTTVVPESRTAYIRALESLIAQHTILPARSTFFATRLHQSGYKKHSLPAGTEQQVTKVLEPLGLIIRTGYEAVPVMLDVALRAVPTPTPGQRSRESPWIEALFDALLDLLDSYGTGHIEGTITDMLRCLRAHKAALPAQKLLSLASNTLAASAARQDICWDLVAEIASLNAGVLTERPVAGQLFASIGADQSSRTKYDSDFMRHSIIKLLIDGFVRKSQVEDLLELWHLQLLGQTNGDVVDLWVIIAPDVAEAISTPTASGLTAKMVDRYSTLLQDLTDSRRELSENGVADRLRADLVVLRAVLQGSRSECHAPTFRQGLDQLRTNLMSLQSIGAKHVPPALLKEIWQLFTVVFELWIPSCVAAEVDETAVQALLTELAASHLLKTAIEDCQSATQSRSAARVLVAAVSHVLHRYNFDDKYNDVLLEPGEFVSSQFDGSPHGNSISATWMHADADLLALDHDAQQLLAHITSAPHLWETSSDLKKAPPQRYDSPALASLSPAQRGKIVLELLDVDPKMPQPISPRHRLALILTVVAYPVEDSKSPGIASSLFAVARLGSVKASRACGTSPSGTGELSSCLGFLAPVVRAICQSLSATQSLPKHKLSETVVKHVGQLKDSPSVGATYDDALGLLISSTIACLEERAAEDDTPYAHRDKQVLCTLLEHFITGLESTTTELVEAAEVIRHTPNPAAAEALLILPESVWSFVGSKRKKFTQRIVKAADSILQADLEGSDPVLATSFRLICKHGFGSNLTGLTIRLLSRNLVAKDNRIVLQAYEESLGATISADKIESTISSETPHTAAVAQVHVCMIRKLAEMSSQTVVKFSTPDLWHHLLSIVSGSHDLGVRSEVLHTIVILLKSNKHTLNQYSLEETLTAMHRLLEEGDHVEAVFPPICDVLKVLLNQYRTQLQGRFHLVTTIFRTLLSTLFDDSSVAPHHIRERHARMVAKLLELFCKPVWVRSSATNLIDASREAQKYAGQFVQHILHQYCAQLLSSSSAEVIRMALRPGIFAVLEAMEAYDEAAIRSLSAAMSSNERAILRIVVQDWRQFGKWEGS